MSAVSEDVGGMCRRQKSIVKGVGGTACTGNHRVLGHYRQLVVWKVKCRWYGMQLRS